MSEFNLIPGDYAREQALRRYLRWALASFVVLCCLVVVGRVALGVLVAREAQQVAALQVKKKLWQESKAKTEKYASEALATEKQLAALDQLRGREHLRYFLEALDGAYLDKVWFDEIRYYRRDLAPALPVAEKRVALPPPRVEQRVGMTGHAVNHVMLADFMRRLQSQPAVADLTLFDTSPRNYPHGLIIDFKLGLLVQPSVKGVP